MTSREQAKRISDLASNVEYDVAGENWLSVCQNLGTLATNLLELSADAAQAAFNGGATKKSIGEALGVPASTFTGMVKTGG